MTPDELARAAQLWARGESTLTIAKILWPVPIGGGTKQREWIVANEHRVYTHIERIKRLANKPQK